MKTKNKTHTAQTTSTNGADDGTLATRAMLVDLHIGFWEGAATDKKTSREVLTNKKAADDSGRWRTRLIPKRATRGVVLARCQARSTHYRYTLPWCDEGQRILPADAFMEYQAEMAAAKAVFDKEVKTFLNRYPTYYRRAKARLGALYDPKMFPDVKVIAGRFPWNLRFIPLPVADDFRVALDAEAVAEIKKSIRADAQNAAQAAMGALWERLHGLVENMAKRLGKSKGVFRDSLCTNIKDLCNLLPKLNVTNDPKLEQMRADVLKHLANADPKVLRENKAARAHTARRANKILGRIESVMGIKAAVTP